MRFVLPYAESGLQQGFIYCIQVNIIEMSRKGTSNSFSRIGASSLVNLRTTSHRKLKKPFAENEQQAKPLNAYIDALIGSVNVNYESAKRKLKDLQDRREEIERSSMNKVKRPQELLKLADDIEPHVPTDYFLENMSKYENNHKPRGCALSCIAQERYESQRQKDPEISRTTMLAKRQFQREILHMRRGILSLKTINKNK